MRPSEQLQEAAKKTKRVKLTARQKGIFDGLSNAARRLLNDLAYSKEQGRKYMGQEATYEAKKELEKHKIVQTAWHRGADDPKQPLCWLTDKVGAKFGAYALQDLRDRKVPGFGV